LGEELRLSKLYKVVLDVPAGTSETNPVSETIELEEAILVKGDIIFRAGCHECVKVAVFYGDVREFPLPPEEAFEGDDETITFTRYYPLDRHPFTMTFKAWSPEAQYSHRITIRLLLVPKWLAAPYFVLAKLVELLEKMLGIV